MVLTPGPNMVYLVSRSVTQGRVAGLVSLAGVALGFACYLVAATLGITSVFAAVPQLYTALKIAGALYLAWMAWQALRPGGKDVFARSGMLAPDGRRKLFVMGLTTNLLNPKIAVLYLALIPQFIRPGDGPVWAQSLVLGSVQIAVALTVNGLIVCLAGGIATFLSSRPGWVRAQKAAMGTVLGALAVHLLVDKSRPVAA